MNIRMATAAVFLALVAVQLRGRTDGLVAVASGALAVAVALVVPGNWHIVVVGLIVSGVAALVLEPEAA